MTYALYVKSFGLGKWFFTETRKMPKAPSDRKCFRRAFKIQDGIPLSAGGVDQFRELQDRIVALASLPEPSKRVFVGQIFIPGVTLGLDRELEQYKGIYGYIRAQTARADGLYLKDGETKELVCALSRKDAPGAWAISCKSIDAVVVSVGLLVKLRKLAEYFTNTLLGPLSRDGMPEASFFDAYRSKFQSPETSDELSSKARRRLSQLLEFTAISYILGHEFGHLAQGHLTRGALPEPDAGGPEGADNLFGAIDSAGLCGVSIRDQAFELDADVQGWYWAKDAIRRLAPQPSHVNSHIADSVLNWVREDAARLGFLLTSAALLAFLSLGAEEFNILEYFKKHTHPPSSLRAMVATDSLTVERLTGNDAANRRHLEYAEEARLTASLAALVDTLEARSDEDSEAEALAREFIGMKYVDAGKRAMLALGISPPRPESRRPLDEYLNTLASQKRRREFSARWPAEFTVRWTTSGIKATRDAAQNE
ncbi:hypothetical protein [Trinickia soli]|uniref:hypothetical protein n=1 Tax=Trinickia soli TaxID=380675 RepID=UPI003FA3B802